MIKLILKEIVEAISGRPAGDLPTISIQRVSIDSRGIKSGDLFFAIPGPRFDGHEFVADAFQAGAAAAIVAADRVAEVQQRLEYLDRSVLAGAIIAVDDTVAALGRLAAFHRGMITGSVISVVGSNGKTTTKAIIDHILAGRMRGHCSPKSFNNQIGVPLTLLSADASDEYMVVEIGTSAPGEITTLAKITRPDMAVITSIAEEHLEGLGDLDGVAAEECSILSHLDQRGFAAVNLDTPAIKQHLPTGDFSMVTFGWADQADIRLTAAHYDSPWLHFTLNGRFEYRLPVAGLHNAVNATGAITIARRLGLDHEEISSRLEAFVPPPMRSEVFELAGITVVNDAYNANPGSVEAAFELLESLPCRGRRIVVFGEMRELGERSAELHRQVGRRLAGGQFQHVYLIGAAAELMSDVFEKGQLFGPRVEHCDNVEVCLERLLEELQDGDVVLLKASRAVGLDQLVEPLAQRLGTSPCT